MLSHKALWARVSILVLKAASQLGAELVPWSPGFRDSILGGRQGCGVRVLAAESPFHGCQEPCGSCSSCVSSLPDQNPSVAS